MSLTRAISSFQISRLFFLFALVFSVLVLEIAGDDCDDDDSNESCDDDGLSDGAIIGIVIGGIAVLIAVPILLCFCCSCFCFKDRKTIILSASSLRRPKGAGVKKWGNDERPSAAVIFTPENENNNEPIPHQSSYSPAGVAIVTATPSAPTNFEGFGDGDSFYYLGMSQPPPPYPYPLPMGVGGNDGGGSDAGGMTRDDRYENLAPIPHKSAAGTSRKISVVSANSSSWSRRSSIDEDIEKQTRKY